MSRVVELAPARLRGLTLEQLWQRAEEYGAVLVYAARDIAAPRCYRVKIEFRTVKGVSLEAASDFNMGLADALIMAIGRAEEIRGQFR